MNKSKQVDNCVIDFHAGIIEDRLGFIIAFTNNGEDTFYGESPMSAWCELKLKDEDGVRRTNSKGQLAMVTPWEIESGGSLVNKITPNTLEEAEKEAQDWNNRDRDYSFTSITNIDEYKNKSEREDKIRFIPNVCLDRDKNVTFHAEAIIKISPIHDKLSMKFNLSDISELPDISNIYNTK